MLNYHKSVSGTRTDAGNIVFRSTGLPGDLATRLPGAEIVSTIGLPRKTFQVKLTAPAEVVLEANEGDPTAAGDWYALSTVSAAGEVEDNNVRKFVRARVTDASGGVTVHLTASA